MYKVSNVQSPGQRLLKGTENPTWNRIRRWDRNYVIGGYGKLGW